MNFFKIRFADVLRYFILGCIEVVLYYSFSRCSIIGIDGATEVGWIHDWNSVNDILPTPLILAILCIGLFLIGFISQSIIHLFFGGNFFGTGIGEIADFIRFYPQSLQNRHDYPNWLYWSDKPSRVVEIYRNVLETEDISDSKTEFLYANQLFQGIAFAVFILFLNIVIPDFLWFIVVSFIIICALHYVYRYNTCPIKYIILSNSWIGVALAILLCTWLLANNLIGGITLAGFFMCSIFCASQLARKQIRRIDILANFSVESSIKFRSVLKSVGAPTVYILTRTNSAKYLNEELESILIQKYPDIKVIVLIDEELQTDKKKVQLEWLFEILDSYRDRLSLHIYGSRYHGPASLAYEIRNIFKDYAKDDDIALLLDSDDKLYSPESVSQIVTKLYRTESNICLLSYEVFGMRHLNYSKRDHNEIVKILCHSGKLVREDLHRISTIGWTKCYRKMMLLGYQEMVDHQLINPLQDLENKCYEDFPDIIAVMQKEAKICAVEDPSIMFRRRGDSITSSNIPENYSNHIPFFLKLTKELTIKNHERLIDGGIDVVNKLISYKFMQYMNIVYKKTNKLDKEYDPRLKYTCKQFYLAFIKELYANEEQESSFRNSVVDLINSGDVDNLKLFPKNDSKTVTWADISDKYKLS